MKSCSSFFMLCAIFTLILIVIMSVNIALSTNRGASTNRAARIGHEQGVFKRAFEIAEKLSFIHINDALHLACAEKYARSIVTFDKDDFRKLRKHTAISVEILESQFLRMVFFFPLGTPIFLLRQPTSLKLRRSGGYGGQARSALILSAASLMSGLPQQHSCGNRSGASGIQGR